jgi:hypothetical protein
MKLANLINNLLIYRIFLLDIVSLWFYMNKLRFEDIYHSCTKYIIEKGSIQYASYEIEISS